MLRNVSLSLALGAAIFALGTTAAAARPDNGDQAPDFTAKGIDGRDYNLSSVKDAKATVICFTCNTCPIATAYEDRFIEFANNYESRGVRFLAINVNYTENLDVMRQRAQEKKFPYPYAFDASGDSCRAFGALTTPDLFVLDGSGKIVYQGAFDDNNNSQRVTKHFVQDAVDAVLAGNQPEVGRSTPRGCRILPNN